jgi:hypothetical protein
MKEEGGDDKMNNNNMKTDMMCTILGELKKGWPKKGKAKV